MTTHAAKSLWLRGWHAIAGQPPRDHRGRRVRLMFLDPTPLGHFRRRTDLNKETHAAIKLEYAYRTRVEQGLIMAIVLFAMILIGFTVLDIAVRILAETNSARSMFMLGFLCVFLFPIPAGLAIELWVQRRNSVIKIDCMLQHARCPSCAHDLTGTTPDPADDCTLCPECGAAWRRTTSTQQP